MKMIKTLLIGFLLLTTFFGSQNVNAQEVAEMDDPEYWSTQGYVDDTFYDKISISDGTRFSNPGRGEYTLRKGIDVSKWQGDIDWKKAKDAGVEFAIIRVGYRSSSTGNLGEDEKYIQNIEGALANDIRVGVYIFSQAINEKEAIEEANYVLSRIYRYNITLPVVIDYEYRSGQNGVEGRLYDAHLSKEHATDVCRAFCETVESAGYTGMVYANASMLKNQLNAEELASDYRIWLAHYTSSTNYAGTYDFWQYTSTGDGYAHGMESQYVDLDWWYDDGSIYGKDYSAVFDAEYYADTNADVEEEYGDNAAELLAHFVNYGMNEGRQGIESFNVYSYKNLYSDLRQAFGNDLAQYYQHYIDYGEHEGRIAKGYENSIVGAKTTYNGIDYSAVYDANYYLNNNTDLLRAFGYDENQLIAHFVNFGMSECRQGSANFNVMSYRNLYSDLRRAFGTDFKQYYMHYVNFGQKEGRMTVGYENKLVDGTTIYNGVDYSAVYDASYYLENNKDVLNAFGYDENQLIAHFVNFGMSESRQGNAEFNAFAYKNKYEDLRAAYGDDLKSYYMHYINFGKNEGRRVN